MKKPNNTASSQKNILDTPLEETGFVIFDLEGTGGNPLNSGLTEVFALSFHPGEEEAKTFHSLINPRRRIPPIVRKLTNITNEMVKDAPIAEKVMPDFLEFIKGKVLVSHNTLCDLKFIDHYSRKLKKRPLENFFLCTHLLSEKLLPESKQKSLSGLCTHLDINLKPNHRAEEDTICTKDLFRHLLVKLKEKKIGTLKEAIQFQGDLASAIKLGWKIPEREVKQIPRSVGVLSFHGRSKEHLFSIASGNCHQTFQKIKDLASLPKPLARSLTKAHKLDYTKHQNLLEAKLASFPPEEKHHKLFDKLRLEPSFATGIAVTKRQENLYEVSVGHPKEKNLFFYGPFSHYKVAGNLLHFLAQKLFASELKKDKLMITEKNLELLLLVLNKRKYLYLIRGLQPQLKERNLRHYLRSLSCFSHLEQSHKKIRNLREESGLLFLENGDSTLGGKVYCVLSGALGESLTITTPYDSWLTSRQGIGFIKKFLLHPSQSQEIARKLLTKREASITNLVLWFICTQTPRKNRSSKRFTPKESLIKLIKTI